MYYTLKIKKGNTQSFYASHEGTGSPTRIHITESVPISGTAQCLSSSCLKIPVFVSELLAKAMQ